MNSSISQPRRISATAAGSVPGERLGELREVNARLQLLVCELLEKNLQLHSNLQVSLFSKKRVCRCLFCERLRQCQSHQVMVKTSGFKLPFDMESIHTLFATQPAEPSRAILHDRYDGNLSFPSAPEERPYCIANFVSTLDRVVSFNLPGQSEGAQISGSNEEDRFIMGLLRASVDVVVGSGTLRTAGPQGSWLPEAVYQQLRIYTRSTEPRCSESWSIHL